MRLALLVGLLVVLVGCGPRYARETVVDEEGIRVFLRSQQVDGKPLPRGFAHPAAVSPVRMAHILSRIDVVRKEQPLGPFSEGEESEREAAVPLEVLYGVADALASALERAGPDQEVVVMVQRRERRLGIFTHDRLTSFVAFVQGERLHLHFSHVDWELPRGETEVPEPFVDSKPVGGSFRILPSDAMESAGSRAVRVAWRDPLFRKPSAVRLAPGGRLMRRTILMESPEEAEATEEPPEPDVPRVVAPDGAPALSPEVLRALADLEEARRRGEVSEAEYQSRRREILREE